jgi:hypothetical protein
MTTININEYVWAELTEYGWQSLASYYEKLFSGCYPFAKGSCSVEDCVDLYKKETISHTIDGVERMLTRFQLHDFMCTFGDKITFGSKNVIVDNNLFYGLED